MPVLGFAPAPRRKGNADQCREGDSRKIADDCRGRAYADSNSHRCKMACAISHDVAAAHNTKRLAGRIIPTRKTSVTFEFLSAAIPEPTPTVAMSAQTISA